MSENWWAVHKNKLISSLGSSNKGLSEQEAKNRLRKYGQNVIPERDKKEWVEILIAQFTNPLLLILIGASIISIFVGELFDTIIIIAVVIISALLGFMQEYKSEKVLAELKKYFSYKTVVLREGKKRQIDTRELVPGDIVDVRLGDIIPADLRILESEGIVTDESVLTGESMEVIKDADSLSKPNANPQEIKNGLFMGTTVVNGYAKAIVVATGKNTFFGKTAVVFSSKVPESDFQINMRKFGDVLLKIVLGVTLVVFLSNYILGHGEKNPLIDSLLFALAIAIGIAPEALPAIITITLSSGSMALAKKRVITKKLAAIEDLGNMDVLCTDKTGTLTDEIEVDKYIDLDKKDSYDVLEYAVLCNSAVGTIKIIGNPIDIAIRKYAIAANINVGRFKKIQEIPFDFVRKMSGQVVKEGKKTLLIVKGAPEAVLERCSKIKTQGKEYPAAKKISSVKKMIADYNREGNTIIGVAYRELPPKKRYTKEDEKDLIFIGFVLFKNHPKESVKPTLERLKKLNVSLKILTGDDPLVTQRLCHDVGIKVDEKDIIVGADIKEIKDEELSGIVENYTVFARVTPEQKLRIIETLRKNGHVVGFLGDGINDAPALRTADVGISVDSAADIAKGASHIILLEKGLDVICDGIEEGRKIFGNITKYILNTMSANQGNMITITASSFFLPFIPLLPSQILLNNLLSDVPLMSIATDNVDEQYTKKPQRWDMKLIIKFMVFFGLISTVFDFMLILSMYYFMQLNVETFRTAWFLESVLTEMIIVFSLRTYLPFFKNTPSRPLVLSSIVAVFLSIAAIYFGSIAPMFHFVPLAPSLLLFIAAIIIAYFVVSEIGKIFFFRYLHKID